MNDTNKTLKDWMAARGTSQALVDIALEAERLHARDDGQGPDLPGWAEQAAYRSGIAPANRDLAARAVAALLAAYQSERDAAARAASSMERPLDRLGIWRLEEAAGKKALARPGMLHLVTVEDPDGGQSKEERMTPEGEAAYWAARRAVREAHAARLTEIDAEEKAAKAADPDQRAADAWVAARAAMPESDWLAAGRKLSFRQQEKVGRRVETRFLRAIRTR